MVVEDIGADDEVMAVKKGAGGQPVRKTQSCEDVEVIARIFYPALESPVPKSKVVRRKIGKKKRKKKRKSKKQSKLGRNVLSNAGK